MSRNGATAVVPPGRAQSRSRKFSVSLWAVQILLALVFLSAGTAKLAGVERLVDLFGQIGVGQWFRFVTAALEIIGALALLHRATAFWGHSLSSASWPALCSPISY